VTAGLNRLQNGVLAHLKTTAHQRTRWFDIGTASRQQRPALFQADLCFSETLVQPFNAGHCTSFFLNQKHRLQPPGVQLKTYPVLLDGDRILLELPVSAGLTEFQAA
jgi:hypothetical protein